LNELNFNQFVDNTETLFKGNAKRPEKKAIAAYSGKNIYLRILFFGWCNRREADKTAKIFTQYQGGCF
jgi:hypothetical protein